MPWKKARQFTEGSTPLESRDEHDPFGLGIEARHLLARPSELLEPESLEAVSYTHLSRGLSSEGGGLGSARSIQRS